MYKTYSWLLKETMSSRSSIIYVNLSGSHEIVPSPFSYLSL